MLIAAFALCRQIKQLQGDRVGILLPASAASVIVFFACLYARKIPVMLNWTLGAKNLADIAHDAELQAIISSSLFLQKAKTMDLNGVEQLLAFIQPSLLDRLYGALRSWLPLFHPPDPKDIAVILFTSGTETKPKGVPLSHSNILSNQRAAWSGVSFAKEDVLLSFLPPFHAFGLSMTALLPLFTGLRVVFSPDPTDGLSLAKAIAKWQVSILVGAPSLLAIILRSGTKELFAGLRLMISGAEKAPKKLFDSVRDLGHVEFIEGYGITECSPVLTIALRGEKGVGKPLAGVEIIIVDPDTHELLACNKEGLILAHGPNVFGGYLQKNLPSPFLGKWYMTGDLGFVDEEGCLTLSGRLKRFVKIGGEMINLSAIEESLLQALHQEEVTLAVCAQEEDGKKAQLVLFTTSALELEQVNRILRQAGFSLLIKISHLVCLPSLPLLGIGKIDYRALQSMLAAR